jgi:hypothetical protein
MKMSPKRLEVFLEFLCFGVIMGVIEDMIAVRITSGTPITWKVFGVIVLIAIPFAFIGEMIVDKINFVKLFRRFFSKKRRA